MTKSYTDTELSELANQVKELVLSTMHVEGELPGDPEQLSATYAVILVRGSMLGRLWNKMRGIEDNDSRWVVVKSTDLQNEGE